MRIKRGICLALVCSVFLAGSGVYAEQDENQAAAGSCAEGEAIVNTDAVINEDGLSADAAQTAGADETELARDMDLMSEGNAVQPAEENKANILPVEPGDPESMQQYKDFSYYDPQWVTDKALFGEWDGKAWVPQAIKNGTKSGGTTVVNGPLLKYDLEKYADTMKPIEAAAREGDYTACKELLLEHYRQKYALLEPMKGSNTRKSEINAQTLFYNLAGYSNGTDAPIEFLEVGSNPSWYSTDITDAVTSVGADTAAEKGILALLVALRRDGVRAKLDSKEGANPPYIEVELSDGTKKTFKAQFDASMSAGGNMTKNYGTLPTIEIEESVSSMTSANNVDSNTSRAYVRFDMAALTPEDAVRSARLYMYGSTNSGDISYKKQIAIYKTGYTNGQNEKTFNWNSVQHYIMSDDGKYTFDYTDTRYVSGNFVDTVYRAPARVAGAISDCVSRFLATGNEEYAYHAIRNMLGLCMERGMLGNPKDTGIYWPYSSLLCLGNRGQTYQNRLRGLINSKYMTPEVFACLLKLAWTTAEQLEYGWRTNETNSNWGNTEAAALFNMALYFDEFEDCHKPLSDYEYQAGSNGKSGGWSELSAYRLILKSGEIMFPDGSCTEIPMGYTDYSLSGFINSYNMAVTANMEDDFPQSILDAMESLIEYIILTSAPDGSGWSQGNGKEHSATYAIDRSRWFKNKTDNPLIHWYASGRSVGIAPKQTSAVYPIGLKYISRGGWGTDAVGAHFNADGACNVHGHADDLSFNLAAYGEYLLVDNGVYDYTDNATRAWQISTRGHNTIEINGVGQKAPMWSLSSVHNDPFGSGKIYLPDYEAGNPDSYGRKMTPGYFMNVELNNGYEYVRGGTNNYKDRKIAAQKLKWNDYKYERSIMFIRPDFYLITDYIEPLTNKNEVNTYDQRWHTMPGVSIDIDESTGTAKTSGQNASVIIAPVNQKDPVEAAVERGLYSNKEGSKIETQNAKYTKKTAGITTMNTVIYPVAPGKSFDISTQNIELSVPESKASAFSAKITDLDLGTVQDITKYEKHTDRSKREVCKFGEYETDGYLAYSEKTNGGLTSVALQGGTYLKDRYGNYLIKSDNATEGLSVSWQGSLLELNTSKAVVRGEDNIDTESELDLDRLTVYAPNYTKNVKLNGETITYSRSGNYLYFGSAPVIDDGETTPPKEEQAKPVKPSGGSSHGSSGGGGGFGGGSASAPGTSDTGIGNGKTDGDLYAELKGHWAETEIGCLIDKGIIKGGDDGLHLCDTLTRAEFAAMILRAVGIAEEPYQGTISDVSDSDWFAGVIQASVSHGIMNGSDGLMRPNSPITREEMAKIIVSAYEQTREAQNETASFADSSEISDWAVPYVNKASALGLIRGFEDGTFRPGEATLREQAMVVVYRLITRK